MDAGKPAVRDCPAILSVKMAGGYPCCCDRVPGSGPQGSSFAPCSCCANSQAPTRILAVVEDIDPGTAAGCGDCTDLNIGYELEGIFPVGVCCEWQLELPSTICRASWAFIHVCCPTDVKTVYFTLRDGFGIAANTLYQWGWTGSGPLDCMFNDFILDTVLSDDFDRCSHQSSRVRLFAQ